MRIWVSWNSQTHSPKQFSEAGITYAAIFLLFFTAVACRRIYLERSVMNVPLIPDPSFFIPKITREFIYITNQGRLPTSK